MKLLWLDTETTGLNKEKCDIIQLAGIVIINGEEKEVFKAFYKPWDTFTQDTEQVLRNIVVSLCRNKSGKAFLLGADCFCVGTFYFAIF